MDVESRLDQALERAGRTVQPDVTGALREVRARERRGRRDVGPGSPRSS